jgi:DNA-binding MarR family transcriptional regulator
MMRIAHQWVLAQVYARVVAAGYEDLGRSHVAMFRYPTPDGLRPSELADQLQITKQSVNDLLGEMEERGYLVRVDDPTDGRARVIRLTAKGRQLEKTVYDGAQSAELAIAELLGPRHFTQLRDALETVASYISERDVATRRHPE